MLLSLGAVVLACLLAPAFVIVILSFLIAVQSGFGLMSVLLARRPRETPAPDRHAGDGGHGEDVCFSVHVPTHSEPPSVVIATVSALARQIGAPPFEVIVIDNNTTDPALWHPVRDWCAGQPNIRFLHREGVDGAKAGALNIALSESRPDATHVVTVDADYVVERDFLFHAAAALAEWDADFIQFPQAYFGEDHAPGAALELGDYFLRHARTANGADAMLLTGTLSVISRPALDAAGGWRADTVTEDAELGLRLCRAGFRGRYVERTVGRGYLPFDVLSLHRQRCRWTAGNVRTLMLGLVGSGLAPRRAVLVASQLLAWANLGLIFTAGLIAGATFARLNPSADPHKLVPALSTVGLLACYAAALGPLVVAAVGSGTAVPTLRDAILTRIALLPGSALATCKALAGARPGFVVTGKSSAGAARGIPSTVIVAAALGLSVAAMSQNPADLLGAILLILPLPACLATERSLRTYRARLADNGV